MGPPKGPGRVTAVTAPRPRDLSDSHPLPRARDPHYSTALPPGPCPHGQTPLLLGPLGEQGEALQAEARHPQGLGRMLFVSGNIPVPRLGSPIEQQVEGGAEASLGRREGQLGLALPGATRAPGLGWGLGLRGGIGRIFVDNQAPSRRGCHAHCLVKETEAWRPVCQSCHRRGWSHRSGRLRPKLGHTPLPGQFPAQRGLLPGTRCHPTLLVRKLRPREVSKLPGSL